MFTQSTGAESDGSSKIIANPNQVKFLKMYPPARIQKNQFEKSITLRRQLCTKTYSNKMGALQVVKKVHLETIDEVNSFVQGKTIHSSIDQGI